MTRTPAIHRSPWSSPRLLGLVLTALLAVACASPGDGDGPPGSEVPDDPGTADGGTGPGDAGDGDDGDEDGPRRCRPSGDRLNQVYYEVLPEGVVDPERVSLDLTFPELPSGVTDTAPLPVFVYVHGGGWRTGDKRNVGEKVAFAHDRGWAFATLNYRLSPVDVTILDPDRVTYPTHAEDVARGVAWLLDHADELCLDPRSIALVGFSAGANLVATVSTDPRFLGGRGHGLDDLACTVVLDTAMVDPPTFLGVNASPLYVNAFTDDPALWLEASPIDQVREDRPHPDHLVVTRGSPFRTEINARYVRTLVDAGVRASLLRVPELTHAEVNARLGQPGDTLVTPSVARFLTDCFAGGPRPD